MKYAKLITSALLLTSAQCSLVANAAQQRDFSASPSPDAQSFVYYSYRNDALPDLFVNTIDGDEKQITSTPDIWEIEPDWSANGKYIAYAAGESMADLEIFIAAPDGSHAHQLTDDNLANSGPHFSPDSKTIIFNRFDRGADHSVLVKIDLDSGKEQVLLDNSHFSAFKPKFSPDGKFIAFLAAPKDEKVSSLFVMNADGSHLQQLNTDTISVGMLDWSEDNQILFTGAKGQANNQLYSYDIKNTEYRHIPFNEEDHIYFISTSDDGEKIFFDFGDWNTNFFIHQGEIIGHHLVAERLSGDQFIHGQQAKLDQYLAPFVGKWQGISTEGPTKGHFREESTYSWGPNKTSLNVDMKYFWDSELMGSARGYMAIDRDADKAYFNLVMQDGTVVMQEQINSGNAKKFEMNGKSSGDGKAFPHEFKTELVKIDKDSWKSHVFRNIDGNWQRTSVHKFSRVQ